MITFSIQNLQQLYSDVWGTTPVFLPTFNTAPGIITSGEYGSPYRINDAIGREVYMPVKLTIPQNGTVGIPFQLDYPIVHVTGQTTVNELQMTERTGSVHDSISISDYTITVRGFIVNNDNDDLLEDSMDNYYQLLEANTSVIMRSVLTDRLLHPDYHVVLKKMDFPIVKGFQQVKPYELDFVSDFINELIIS